MVKCISQEAGWRLSGAGGGRTGRCLAGRVLLWEDEVFWELEGSNGCVNGTEQAGEVRGLRTLSPDVTTLAKSKLSQYSVTVDFFF